MTFLQFLKLIKAKAATIGTFVVISVVLAVVFCFLSPLKYTSTARLLVVSSNTNPQDVSQPGDYISSLLAKVAYSSDFFNQVAAANLGVDESYFGATPNQQLKKWAKTIDIKSVAGTGIVEVAAYHPQADQAGRIAAAVSQVLIDKNGDYHGLGNSISIKLLDQPLNSTWPNQPNIFLVLFLAALFGAFLGITYGYLLPPARYDLRLWPVARRRVDNRLPPSELDAQTTKNFFSSPAVKFNQEEELYRQAMFGSTDEFVEPASVKSVAGEEN